VLNEALMKLRKRRTAKEESLDSSFPSDSDGGKQNAEWQNQRSILASRVPQE
jgi:hypothetical protein